MARARTDGRLADIVRYSLLHVEKEAALFRVGKFDCHSAVNRNGNGEDIFLADELTGGD